MAFNIRGTGHYLFEKLRLIPGTRYTVSNFAPDPPHSSDPFGSSPTGSLTIVVQSSRPTAGPFWFLLVPAHQPEPLDVSAPGSTDIAVSTSLSGELFVTDLGVGEYVVIPLGSSLEWSNPPGTPVVRTVSHNELGMFEAEGYVIEIRAGPATQLSFRYSPATPPPGVTWPVPPD